MSPKQLSDLKKWAAMKTGQEVGLQQLLQQTKTFNWCQQNLLLQRPWRWSHPLSIGLQKKAGYWARGFCFICSQNDSRSVWYEVDFVWPYLQSKACSKPHKTIAALKASLLKEWDAIPQEMIQNAIDNFPKRLRLCIAANGGHFVEWNKLMVCRLKEENQGFRTVLIF